MSYKVIQDFADAEDGGYIYKAGDNYPRRGVADAERIAILSGYGNRQKRPLIQAAEDTAEPEKPRRGRKKAEDSED